MAIGDRVMRSPFARPGWIGRPATGRDRPIFHPASIRQILPLEVHMLASRCQLPKPL